MGLLSGLSAPLSDASSSQEELKRFTFTEYHMGMDARLTVYAKTQDQAEIACRAAFERIGQLDSIMSDYRRDSELNRLCAKAGTGPVHISADLFKVLARAQEISAQSEGAFDVTAAPLIIIWRQARKVSKLPSVVELHAARQLVGWQMLKLDNRHRTASLAKPGMKLDLGGIAKGYAVQEAQKELRRHGVRSALVEMGGDITVSDPPPSRRGWIIRVPNAGTDHGPIDMEFANCAISTSGDTEQFAVIGGVQYSHVVDPRTGYALTNRVQATVISKNGLDTDPISTTLTILSDRERARFLKHYPWLRVYIRTLEPVQNIGPHAMQRGGQFERGLNTRGSS